MALESNAVADKLVAMVQALPGVNLVQKGVPEKQDKNLCAYVTMGSQNKTRKATGVIERRARFLVTFSYLVKGGEGVAETALMTAVDAFHAAIDADLTLGDLVRDCMVDAGLSDTPEYSVLAGREFREYPVIVEVTERSTFNVNP